MAEPIPKLKLLAGSLGSSAVFIALAIFGAGGLSAFCSLPPFVAVTIVTFLLAAAAAFTNGNLSTGIREDRGNRWVLAFFTLLGLLQAYLPPYTDRIGFWTFGGDGVRWLGVVLYAIGGFVRLWPVFVLGNRFSGLVAIQPGHRLVTGGIYRYVRHPSYLGMLILLLGWALVFRSSVGILLALLTLVPVIDRIRAEEAMLVSEFGGEYEAYRVRTWRLVPGLY
jgi:protein-S-isoprenylcysteine O-methyltransferase Ste14